ncbi:hypothetical protein [Streptomyces sp. NPDC057889]|uniref:hypothetical protein n=1 Tax=unclassified Streptomyces TaxID=2593676 RepID=UPI00368E4A85
MVSVLTLSARIAESGGITHLPESVRPEGWAAHYAGAEQSWERVAEARVVVGGCGQACCVPSVLVNAAEDDDF